MIDQDGQLIVTPEQLGNWKIIFDADSEQGQTQILSLPANNNVNNDSPMVVEEPDEQTMIIPETLEPNANVIDADGSLLIVMM